MEQDGRLLLAVRAQSVWPGPGQQIFCLRETGFDPAEPLEEIENVVVTHLSKVGRKLSIALDRPQRKRCEFLTVIKPYRGSEQTYEQIFFRTQSGIRAHRSRTRMELRDAPEITIAIDSRERYPWRFPGAVIERRPLPVGDYGLVRDDHIVATIERKTFDNLLSDMGAIQAFHHQLADLANRESAALVIEAQYADFLDDQRLAGRWPASYLARALAELSALHSQLPIIYAGNRKLANGWAARFFAACATRDQSPQLELVRDSLAEYEPGNPSDIDAEIRAAALRSAESFSVPELAAAFPGVDQKRVGRIVRRLRDEGRLLRIGRGRGSRWERVDRQ